MRLSLKFMLLSGMLFQSMVPMAAFAVDPQPDAAHGEILAQKWCIHCHIISSSQKSSVSIGAPSFAAIANRPDENPKWISNFLQAPHPPMPDPQLSRSEINDLIAYIRSQRN
ncbi:MAG TPA: cytochrome c [Bradyrhizobium sp.]|nr:cytochrome c [Bradyrhizobium sp.]